MFKKLIISLLQVKTKKLFSKLKLYEVEIQNSIYESLKKIDTPDEVIMEFVQLYSFDIDFQRDIRKGNKIKIFLKFIRTH